MLYGGTMCETLLYPRTSHMYHLLFSFERCEREYWAGEPPETMPSLLFSFECCKIHLYIYQGRVEKGRLAIFFWMLSNKLATLCLQAKRCPLAIFFWMLYFKDGSWTPNGTTVTILLFSFECCFTYGYLCLPLPYFVTLLLFSFECCLRLVGGSNEVTRKVACYFLLNVVCCPARL